MLALRGDRDEAEAELRLAEGDPAGALERLRPAVAGWRDLGLPYEEARARLLWGAAAAMLGDQEGGRVEIEAARAGFERLGAAADARRAAALLQGRPPRRLLTDREVEVLRLVASGSSNRDIAHALHLSEHTVARHMQNVFAKLGVSSRAAAISSAIEQGQLAGDGQDGPPPHRPAPSTPSVSRKPPPPSGAAPRPADGDGSTSWRLPTPDWP